MVGEALRSLLALREELGWLRGGEHDPGSCSSRYCRQEIETTNQERASGGS